MTTVVPGTVLVGCKKCALFRAPHRVLHVNPKRDTAILIPIEPRRSNSARSRLYFTGYRIYSLKTVLEQLTASRPALETAHIRPRPATTLTDDELAVLSRPRSRRGGKTPSPCPAVARRRARWTLIAPLVTGTDVELLFDRHYLQTAVTRHAQQLADDDSNVARVTRQIHECLNQFWAEGSTPAALTPYLSRCGAPGKRRKPGTQKRGCPNAATAAGAPDEEGFIPTDSDITYMQYGWRNFLLRGQTVEIAYRRLIREFYALPLSQETGEPLATWPPQNAHPTVAQFRYWGPDGDPNQAAWRKQQFGTAFDRKYRALTGSANDGVYAIGQRAAVDSTSPDVMPVSWRNRLHRIGSAYRILVVDSLHGYIPGFYMGLLAPSSWTVGLAFLHALTDKRAWLDMLGLEDISADDWLPMSFTEAVADNTDLRCTAVQEQLHRIGTSLMYVPTRRSDQNSTVETAHHILHRLVDHRLHGTTHGRRPERGEAKADLFARHTVMELLRETTRAIHYHNTVPRDPTVLTLAMKADGVPPTRLAMTRWEIEQGNVARSIIDPDTARAHLLPMCRGTYTESGVRLLRPDRGDRRVLIERLRYVSKHPYVIARMEAARRSNGGRTYIHDADFWVNPYDLSQIWTRVPDTLEFISLELVTRDHDLCSELTLGDVLELADDDTIKRYYTDEAAHRARSTMEAAQEQTKAEAESEYQAELDGCEKTPSKAELCANKRENRERELDDFLYGMPITPPDSAEPDGEQPISGPEKDPSPTPPNTDDPPAEDADRDVLGDIFEQALTKKYGRRN